MKDIIDYNGNLINEGFYDHIDFRFRRNLINPKNNLYGLIRMLRMKERDQFLFLSDTHQIEINIRYTNYSYFPSIFNFL